MRIGAWWTVDWHPVHAVSPHGAVLEAMLLLRWRWCVVQVQRRIAGLELQTGVETPDLGRLGLKLQLDKGSGKMQVVQTEEARQRLQQGQEQGQQGQEQGKGQEGRQAQAQQGQGSSHGGKR